MQHIMNCIANVCLMARANLEDQSEVYRIWRYVNAMHCSAYCGLTDHLTEANFFIPLSKKHGLLGGGKIKEIEQAALRNIDIDDSGVRAACSRYAPPQSSQSSPCTTLSSRARPASPGPLNGRSLVHRRSGRWR